MRKLPLLLIAVSLATPAWAEGPSLQDALAAAYARNPSLAAARAELRATDEKLPEALSGWRPSIAAEAGVGSSRQEVVGTGTDTLAPRDMGIKLSQPLFRGFRTLAARDQAEAQVKAGRAALEGAEQEVLFAAARAYLDVVEDLKVLDLTRGQEELLRAEKEQTAARLAAGEATKTDLSQAEARLQAAHAARSEAEGALARDRASYRRVVGEEAGKPDASALIDAPTQSAEETAAAAEKNSPGVRAASFAEEASRAGVTQAEGALLPEVKLTGSLSRGWEQSVMIPTRQDEATVMARLTFPLYEGGADYARTRAAKERVTQRRLELQDARNAARELALRAWQNLDVARAAKKAKASEIEATDLALQGVREERKAGTRTTLDLLNAEQEALNAKVAFVRAAHDEALALLQVRAASGALTARALGLKVALYDPQRHYEESRGKWAGFGDAE
jgi:TolC family type I secretion outer membrane protein